MIGSLYIKSPPQTPETPESAFLVLHWGFKPREVSRWIRSASFIQMIIFGCQHPKRRKIKKNEFLEAGSSDSNNISKILVLADVAWKPNDNEMENITFDDYDWNKWKK